MKKLLSMLLALMLLALPALSLAEDSIDLDSGLIGFADEPTAIVVEGELITAQQMLEEAVAAGRKVTVDFSIPEVTGINTGEASIDTALTDLLEALGVSFSMQGDEYDMGMSISDKDVLTLGWAVNGKDAYIKSNLLGGTVVINEVEIEPIINRLLDALVAMEAFTEADAADYKEQVAEVFEELKTAFAESMSMAFTEEDLLKLDYSALTSAGMRLMIDMEEIDSPVVPRMCDAATYGVQLSLDNEEFLDLFRAFLQFVMDNPKLKNYIASQGVYYTEEEIDEMWAWYQQNGLKESEESFRERHKTFDQELEEAYQSLDGVKALDGEFVTAVYMNEAGQVVYLSSTLPMFNQEEPIYETTDLANVKGTTEILNVVYTRQTVAQGVSHVCNIDVEGEGATIDVLVQDAGATLRLTDKATEALLLTVDAVVENGAIKGTFLTNEAEETVYSGNFSVAHTAAADHFKTDITFDMTSVFTPEDDGGVVPSINGMTLPGYQAAKPQAETNALAIAYTVDYARNGVDVNGKETLNVRFNDVRVALDWTLTTSEPTESIMAGDVVRPAELDEASFLNWFVGVANNLSSWSAEVITALPESVLSTVLSMGMM